MERVRFARYPGQTALIIVAPMVIAIARGYFADEGVDLEVVEPPDHPWAALADGRADCGLGYVDYCVDPRWAGRLRAVLVHERFRGGHGLTTLLARSELVDSGELSGCASLRGRRIGLLPRRGDDYLAYHGVLVQGGLTIGDVEVVPVPHGGQEREEAIRTGAIDVVIGRRPRHVAQELERGLVRAWRVGDDVHLDLQARYILGATDFLRQRRDACVRFVRAYLRGARDYCDAFDRGIGRADMLALLARETGETPQLLESMKPVGVMPDGLVDRDRLAIEWQAMAERGIVSASVRPDDVVDWDPAAAAVDALGAYR